ncbi:MAG: hypothetical protein ACXW1D_00465 [Halobacteriota archaeon]
MRYNKGAVGQFKIGVVVRVNNTNVEKWDEVGHVTGFGLNISEEICVSVRFAGGSEDTLIHPANLEVL